MNSLNIHIEPSSLDTRKITIGFYLPNGVLHEDTFTQGFSYCIDQCVYESMCAEIEDCNDGEVRVITNYGFSSFLVCCNTEKTLTNLRKMANILLYDELQLEQDVLVGSIWNGSRRKTLDALYYARRSPNCRLSRSLRPHAETTLDIERLKQWKTAYYGERQCSVIITGNVQGVIDICTKDTVHYDPFPTLKMAYAALPKCMPWRYTNLILSADYNFQPNNILCAEAVCKWIDPQMASALNSVGCRFGSFKIHPDYIPEWSIRMQCPRNRESLAISAVREVLASEPKTDAMLNWVRERTRLGYLQMAADSAEWNLFAGYNLITGSRYHLPSLLLEDTYREQITKPSVCTMLQQWRECQKVSIFATAVR